jgi:hypothetical protein
LVRTGRTAGPGAVRVAALEEEESDLESDLESVDADTHIPGWDARKSPSARMAHPVDGTYDSESDGQGPEQGDWRWAFQLGVAAARAGKADGGSGDVHMDSGSDTEPMPQTERMTGTVPQGVPWPPENPTRMDSSPEEPMVPRNGDSQRRDQKGKGREVKGREVRKERDRGKSPAEKQDRMKEAGRTRPKPLERVQGMVGHPPFDFHQWLINTNITMTVMQYLQQSPAARRELNWETALANPGKRGKRRKPRNDHTDGSDAGLYSVRQLTLKDIRPNRFGTFYVTVFMVVGKKKFVCRRSILDPGSDLNLITSDTTEMVGAHCSPTRGTHMSGMAMRTADGGRTRLRLVTTLDFALREAPASRWNQEFFVLPAQGEQCQFSILLGLPWLYDAYAVFDIREFLYTVRTPEGEVIPLQGPPYRPQKFMAIEYPTRVDRLEKATGGYKEKYVYDENNSTWNEIGVASAGMVDENQCDEDEGDDTHMMGLVEIFEQDGVLAGEAGKVPYVDPVTYRAAFWSEGLSSDAAKAWIRDIGGTRQAEVHVHDRLKQAVSNQRERPGLSKN